MPGQKRVFALDVPGIHVLTEQRQGRRGWPGHRRAAATPSFRTAMPGH